MALPFMPFYWGDYWRDTAHLTDAEHVAYLKLISHYWQHNGLPTDDARLARIAGRTSDQWLEMRPVLSEFFQSEWRHGRIDRDLARQTELKDSNIERAKRAANARWNAPSIAQAVHEASSKQCLTNANQNQNHIQNQNIEPKPKSIARGSRLPDDWHPRAEDGIDNQELAKFRDYWKAVPGQKGIKLDWDATWRNWLRNSGKSSNAKPSVELRTGPRNVFKPEPEMPKLSEEELKERARRVDDILKGIGRPVSGLDGVIG